MSPPKPPPAHRAARRATVLALAVLVLTVAAATVATVVPIPSSTAREAALTIFVGSATLAHPNQPARAAHTGDRAADGDTVTTAHDSKAGLRYPDGSVTRLDSDTAVTVHVDRTAQGGLKASLVQNAGLTLNNVLALTRGGSFRISGPNSATADVRGTQFGYYVEHDPTGAPVIWIDTWSGAVQVTGAQPPPVTAVTGQRVTVRANSAPTTPAPIPDGDRQLAFTVFNNAMDAVTGTPAAFATGTLSSGGSAPGGAITTDGKQDLQVVLAWPGSTFKLTVRDPSGAIAAQRTSATPPISLVVPAARAGRWTFTVDDVQSAPGEAWWVVAGVSPQTSRR